MAITLLKPINIILDQIILIKNTNVESRIIWRTNKMENKSVYAIAVDDFKQVHNFEEKDGEIIGPKIKFPKVAYNRIKAFDRLEAYHRGWTEYEIMQLILGKLKKEVYWLHPASREEGISLKPSKKFEQWLDKHKSLGHVLIMLALVYGNYELEE